MTDNIRHLRAAVNATPTDWELRLIYADALEEAGEIVLAKGQRWQARFKSHWGSPSCAEEIREIINGVMSERWRIIDYPGVTTLDCVEHNIAYALDYIANSREWLPPGADWQWCVKRYYHNPRLTIADIRGNGQQTFVFPVFSEQSSYPELLLSDPSAQQGIESVLHLGIISVIETIKNHILGYNVQLPSIVFHGIYLALEYLRSEHVVTGLEKTLRMPELPPIDLNRVADRIEIMSLPRQGPAIMTSDMTRPTVTYRFVD